MADRLAIAAALIALVVRGAVPVWAGLLVILRDLAVLIAGGFLATRSGVRIDVRWIGKAATMALMLGIPTIAWANFGLWAEDLGPRGRLDPVRGRDRRLLRRRRAVRPDARKALAARSV